MLYMIQKPRPTGAERGLSALSRAARAVPAALDAAAAGVLVGPMRAMRALGRHVENRRLLDTMAAMSDHDLRDIGLLRGDLRDAMAVPVGADGSLFLAARRDAHRGHRSKA